MFPLDSKNNAFITPMGMDCYKVMPFGFKNAGATYQRMMSHIFEPLMGKTMEAYIDDMLVKLNSCDNHLSHLRQAFHLMRLHHLRLNLDKWAFRVESRKSLGFFVGRRGIEMTPDQAKAIMKMQLPITKLQILALTRKLVASNQFIS